MAEHKIMRRRLFQAAGLGVLGLWVWGAPRLPQLWQPQMTFSPMPDLPPFRRLDLQGPITAGNVAFVGIGDPAIPNAMTSAEICSGLFGAATAPAIALFSDFNCPNCPQMETNVRTAAEKSKIPVIHHQLPLLGRGSEMASRAVLAADRQGGYAAMYAALSRTPAVQNMSLIRHLAQNAGLDPDQLLVDMNDPETAERLNLSLAIAARLGLIGTPATVIGRSIVLGILPPAQIAQIIAAEQEQPMECA